MRIVVFDSVCWQAFCASCIIAWVSRCASAVMVAGAVGLGGAAGVVVGDLGQVPRLVVASLLYLNLHPILG